MKVPFVDLKAQYLTIKDEIDNAVMSTIHDTAFIGGKHVDEFEKSFAELYGVKHCISVANGTDSLYIIMKMLGIGPGDEVITVAHSWISSSETISQTGAKVVFCDEDPNYFVMDVKQLEGLITSNTKAIMPVHLCGHVCDMTRIMEMATKHGLFVIEDCAQSHFSEWKEQRAGTIGIAGSFSFYPGKNLGAYGDAGCIITNDDELALKCRMYARHGALIKHQHKMEGINSRLDGLQAAILNVKLKYILDWTESRIAAAKYYDTVLSDIPKIQIPQRMPETKHTFHLYMLKVERRDELQAFLKENGIETAIHYPTALPALEAYAYLKTPRDQYKIAEANSASILSIPIYPEISKEMMDHVAGTIRKFYTN